MYTLATFDTPQRAAPHAARAPLDPVTLIERYALADGRIATIRPVLPADVALHRAFIRDLSPHSRYRRFHGPIRELSEAQLRHMTEIDYVDHLAFIATADDTRGNEIQVAEARYVCRPESAPHRTADVGIAVADAWQGQGLGTRLIRMLEAGAASIGISALHADVLAENGLMCRVLDRLGWRIDADPCDARLVTAKLALSAHRAPASAPFERELAFS